MKTKTAVLLSLVVTVLVTAYAAFVYGTLPDLIPTHWDVNGHINGMGPRSTIFLSSGMSLLGLIFLVVLPWLSPKNFRIDSFREAFNYIMLIISVMFGYIGFVMIHAATHQQWDPGRVLIGGILVFIGLMGNFMGKVQRNFFVGIRTPWTLASDTVWVATHRLGARLMTAAGFIGGIAILIGAPQLPVFGAAMVVILYPILYSLLLYKKLERTQSV